MSARKLIFSFLGGENLVINSKDLTEDMIIKFGDGFEKAEVSFDDSILNVMGQEVLPGRVPDVEISIREGRRVTFETGESSRSRTTTPGRLTKTQKRNRNRRLKRRLDQIERETENQEMMVAPTVPDYTPADVITIVEKYVPEHVQRMPPHQIISEEDLDRFQAVRKQNFEHFQRVRGKLVNIVGGLELYTGVFSDREQKDIVRAINNIKDQGRAGSLQPRTYSEPRRWMRGKGRITIQFGCCYNYALDVNGNPPGIIRHEDVDPIPSFLQKMIKRMVAWRILPAESVPDSCIINIYEEGDCIPPHIDSHDFLRPFCTASFLGECDILLGTELKIRGPGEFVGPVAIPLPVGSVFVFEGNGADLVKHCIPAVPHPRISITFRRMDPQKRPYNYNPEPELQGLCPLARWD